MNTFGSLFSPVTSMTYGSGLNSYSGGLTNTTYQSYSPTYFSNNLFSSCPTCGGTNYSYTSTSLSPYKLF